ncbi:hypothetical protein HJFPF1_09466 [Paramyrothecium foliicola]|nr:hypothetical protein HJFPF1_09466 [Paramyrothecium foliicola]
MGVSSLHLLLALKAGSNPSPFCSPSSSRPIMSALPDQNDVQLELGWMPCLVDVRDLKEDWTGVTSTAERRRLQNRLNQRAYRRRKKGGDTPNRPPPTPTVAAAAAAASAGGGGSKGTFALSKTQHSVLPSTVPTANNDEFADKAYQRQMPTKNQEAMQAFAQMAHSSYRRGIPDPAHLPVLIQYNVQSALSGNADTLGLSRLWLDYDAVSPLSQGQHAQDLVPTTHVAMANWPPTLRPTPLQMSVEHHPWIDLFPLPRLRDNVLKALGDPTICDEDELCHDLAQFGESDKPCFIVWGPPWDPRSWEASLPLIHKWGFLLDGCWEVLQATNNWREKRGERRLTLQEIFDAIAQSLQARRNSAALGTVAVLA